MIFIAPKCLFPVKDFAAIWDAPSNIFMLYFLFLCRLVGVGSGQQAWWSLAGSLMFQVPVSNNNKPPEFPIETPGLIPFQQHWPPCWSLNTHWVWFCPGVFVPDISQTSPRLTASHLLCPSAPCFSKAYLDYPTWSHRGFPFSPVVKTSSFQWRGMGSISGQGIKIPHALQHSQKMKWNKITNS